MRRTTAFLGSAVLVLGLGTAAVAGPPDGKGKDKVKECSDGIDNDGDGLTDFEGAAPDSDCGSANDNSEAPDDTDPGGGPAPDPAAIVDELLSQLPSGPPSDPPAPPAPPAELQTLVDTVIGSIPPPPV